MIGSRKRASASAYTTQTVGVWLNDTMGLAQQAAINTVALASLNGGCGEYRGGMISGSNNRSVTGRMKPLVTFAQQPSVGRIVKNPQIALPSTGGPQNAVLDAMLAASRQRTS